MLCSFYEVDVKGTISLKAVVIILVATVSGLGFALGFFYAGRLSSPVKTGAARTEAPYKAAREPGAVIKEASPPDMDEQEARLREAVRAVRSGTAAANKKASASNKASGAVTAGKRGSKPTAARKPAERWFAQAGAFVNPSEAQAFKKALEDKGYKVYIVRHAARSGKLFLRVRVGAFATKEEAARAARRLKDKEDIAAFVAKD